MFIFDNEVYISGFGSDRTNNHAGWWKNNQSMGLLEDYSLSNASTGHGYCC